MTLGNMRSNGVRMLANYIERLIIADAEKATKH
jgi:hypothetical protein